MKLMSAEKDSIDLEMEGSTLLSSVMASIPHSFCVRKAMKLLKPRLDDFILYLFFFVCIWHLFLQPWKQKKSNISYQLGKAG